MYVSPKLCSLYFYTRQTKLVTSLLLRFESHHSLKTYLPVHSTQLWPAFAHFSSHQKHSRSHTSTATLKPSCASSTGIPSLNDKQTHRFY
uniref:Uncharacterized protein n=1 Tax=Kalanchoe fedtschenkoi TaxID=63787 RepID=A0A7N0ZZ40_KALFE